MRKFLVQTQSGNSYELLDETHLFGSDFWVFHKDGIKYAVLCFGKYRVIDKGIITEVTGKGNSIDKKSFIRALEMSIGDALRTAQCRGQYLIAVRASDFKNAIAYLSRIVQAQKADDYRTLVGTWSALEGFTINSSEIVGVKAA